MKGLRTLWAWATALGLLSFAHVAAGQQAEGEGDLTAEAQVSTDDLWGDEEEEEEVEVEAEAGPPEEAGGISCSSSADCPGGYVCGGSVCEVASVPWAGTTVGYGHEALLRPFFVTGESADPTYNPYYAHELYLGPTWSFDDHWRLSGAVSLTQELTNPDDRTGRYDIWVGSGASLSYANLFEVQKISMTPRLSATFPTSPAQQVTTLYVALSPGFSLSRSFDVLEGLTLSYGFSFTKNFHRYKEPSSPPQLIGCENATDTDACTTTSTGGRNTNLSLSNSIAVSLGVVRNLSVSLSGSMGHALAYSSTPATMDDALNGDHNGVLDEDASIAEHDAQGGWRFSQGLALSVSYNVVSYLSASLGVSSSGPQLDPSSQQYNPFLPNRYTTAGLSVSLAVDKFLQEIGPTRAQARGTRLTQRSSEE